MQNAATSAPQMDEPAAKQEPQVSVLHADYFDAVLPETPTVCGIRLKPLSIGRYRLMARFKVAFVSETLTTASAGDLLMGVLICSMDCDEFVQFAGSNKFSKEIKRWGRQFGFLPPRYFDWPIAGKWLRKIAGDAIAASDARDLIGQIKTFQKYIVDGSQSPPFFDESNSGRISGSHWSQSIECVLREALGWTRQEINEEPLTKALWDYFRHMESEGVVRLLTDAEKQTLETPMPADKEAEWIAFAKAVEEAKKKAAATNA